MCVTTKITDNTNVTLRVAGNLEYEDLEKFNLESPMT